jgi:hypothetical protein
VVLPSNKAMKRTVACGARRLSPNRSADEVCFMNLFVLGSACLLLVGCAAEQARGVPLGELLCEEDDDCAVITYDQRSGICQCV